jgi:Flp pilus assembly protein TadG
MGNICSRRIRTNGGAELIEMALVLPLLLVIVAGIVDFGFLFQRFIVLNNAAREGARLAVLPGYLTTDGTGAVTDDSAIDARVQAYVQNGLGELPASLLTTTTMEAVPGITPTVRAARVTTTLDYDYLILGPLSALLGGSMSQVTLTAVATMRVEAGL